MASEKEYNATINNFIETFSFTSSNTREEITKKLNDYLQKQYKGRVSKAKIKIHADDFSESICIRLKIPC